MPIRAKFDFLDDFVIKLICPATLCIISWVGTNIVSLKTDVEVLKTSLSNIEKKMDNLYGEYETPPKETHPASFSLFDDNSRVDV